MTSPRTVVFDLDGTLVDTAPDLISALNFVLAREGLPPVPLHSARNMIGAGARKLIERGLELEGRSRQPGRPRPPDRRLHRLLCRAYRGRLAPVRRPRGRARRSCDARIPLRGLHQQAGMAVEAPAGPAEFEPAVFRHLRRRHLRGRQARSRHLAPDGRSRRRRTGFRHHGGRCRSGYRRRPARRRPGDLASRSAIPKFPSPTSNRTG